MKTIHRPGWQPIILRQHREAHGLTLEAAGDQLRQVAHRHGLSAPAANFQTLWAHEQGSVYPGPHYRRAYCLLYQANEPTLGFRLPLPGEIVEVENSISDLPQPSDPAADNAAAQVIEQTLVRVSGAPANAEQTPSTTASWTPGADATAKAAPNRS
ncbi:hypothetical protein ACFQE7_32195 [Nonomuraea ferruginea]|uniref:hypothetical protein n=1 Tax=Nonomuraea ferruginea TaxID=46174 RepID=UPI00361AA2E1